MRGHLSYAEGAPSATLVLPARAFPPPGPALAAALAPVQDWLARTGRAAVTKLALIAPSRRPGDDLDYRFVQLLPGPRPGVELRGSCGHSIIACLPAAAAWGWIAPLRPSAEVLVNVLNNGDRVRCEVEGASPSAGLIGAQFLHAPPVTPADLLLLGEPASTIRYRWYGWRQARVSVVSAGNPYVFVDGAELGLAGTGALFRDPALFGQLTALRRAVCGRLGWPAAGAFPKIAALLGRGPGRIAALAISVPSWHPTIAVTGAVCLAAAAGIPGTIPHRLAAGPPSALDILTAAGPVRVSAAFDHSQAGGGLRQAGLGGMAVRSLGPVDVDPVEIDPVEINPVEIDPVDLSVAVPRPRTAPVPAGQR